MTDVLPKIRVTDPHTRDATPLERQDTGKAAAKVEGTSRPFAPLYADKYEYAQCANADNKHRSERSQTHLKGAKPHNPNRAIERITDNATEWQRGAGTA